MGDWPNCRGDGAHKITPRDAQIHTSERVLVYEDPRTGKITIPPTTDRSSRINQKNEQFGLIPRMLETHQQVRSVEKATGLHHERNNYDLGSNTSDKDLGRAFNTGQK